MKKIRKNNLGMTYVELIVVLAIFSIMSGVVLVNYQDFQHKVEVKSLSNDIALKVVEAQKSAMSGKLAPIEQQKYQTENGLFDAWKPSYGLFFSRDVKGSFIYFADLNNSVLIGKPAYDMNVPICKSSIDFIECLDQISLKKGYSIGDLTVFCSPSSSGGASAENAKGTNQATEEEKIPTENLSIDFTRPDSRAYIQASDTDCQISYATISLTSSNQASATITVYSSGRIQIN